MKILAPVFILLTVLSACTPNYSAASYGRPMVGEGYETNEANEGYEGGRG